MRAHTAAAALVLLSVSPLAAQARTDTMAVHPGDTVKVVVPSGCPRAPGIAGTRGERRCTVSVQGSSTMSRTVLRVTPRPAAVTETKPAEPILLPGAAGPADGPSGAAGVLFSSDWSSGLGESSNAVTDGGKWSVASNNTEDRLTVISSAGLDFPSTSILAIRHRTSRFVALDVQGKWSPPRVGEHRYYRMYWRNGIQGGNPPGDNSAHPVVSYRQFRAFRWHHGVGATFPFYFAVGDEHRWETTLQRDVTYRVEWHVERVSATAVRFEARIYRGEQLVAGPDALRCSWHRNHALAGAPPIEVGEAGMAAFGDLRLGHEGDAWQFPDDRGNRTYYGGYAVSSSGWLGPYRRS